MFGPLTFIVIVIFSFNGGIFGPRNVHIKFGAQHPVHLRLMAAIMVIINCCHKYALLLYGLLILYHCPVHLVL